LDLNLIIFFVAIVINIARVVAELIFVDPRRLRIYQRMMGEWRKKAKEAIRSGNVRLMEKVKREKYKIDSMGLEVSKMRFKSFIALSIISTPLIFIVIVPYRSEGIYVPMFSKSIAAIWYFMIVSFAISSIASILLKYKGYL